MTVTVTSRPAPSALITFQSLMLGYEDVKRVLTRPLLHLEPDTFHAAHPRMYLSSAFLDTRPLMFGRPALLRTMLANRMMANDTDHPADTSPLLCRWLSGDGSHHHSPLVQQAYGWARGRKHRDYLGTCATAVTEANLRAGNLNGTGHVPRFVTIVSTTDQDVAFLQAWVHVAVVPLVAKDAAAVQERYKWGRTDPGPFLTPEQYEEGDGQVAACMKPITGGDHLAATLPQWMAFQEALGVAKVFVYMLDGGPIVRSLVQHYEQEGLAEVYDFRMSRRLPDPADIINPDKCKRGFVNRRMANQEEGDEWLPCTFLEEDKGELYYWGQLTTTGHCTMNTMARYRWVAVLDYDEWLVPHQGPDMKYVDLFKKVRDNQAEMLNTDARFGPVEADAAFNEEHSGASWPAAFSWRNTYVCVACGSQYHNLTVSEPWFGAPVKVIVPPDPAIPKLWLAPKPSLHEIFWATVRDQIMPENDRSKNFIDPLAVVIMDVHDVYQTWDLTGGASIKIPTGKVKKWACLTSEAGVCYHVRIIPHFTAITQLHTGLKHRYMVGHGRHDMTPLDPKAQPLFFVDQCDHCEHTKPQTVEVDYSIVNFYGHAIMNGLTKFKQAYKR